MTALRLQGWAGLQAACAGRAGLVSGLTASRRVAFGVGGYEDLWAI